MDVHASDALIHFDKFGHVREVKLRVDAEREHIHRQRDDIDVACAFAVAEERAFNPVRARQQSELTISHAATAVVVRVQAEDNFIAELEVLVNVRNLRGVNVRQTHFDGHGDIDNRAAVDDGLPHVEDGVANFEGVFGLGAGETFGRVFKAIICARLRRRWQWF